MYKVIEYHKPFYIPTDIDRTKKEEKNQKRNEDNIHRSVRRTRSTINDYVLNNHFDLFVTFTLDPKKIDRYDMTICFNKMQNYLSVQRRKARLADVDFTYIVVPEKHKDGAIHFHALIGGLPSPLAKTRVIQNSKRVYNVPGFRYGYTNAQYLDDDKQKTTAYLCKYITKDMDLINGRRRYWQSKNLIKPVHYVNKLWWLKLNRHLNKDTVQFENDTYTVHHIDRAILD